MNPGGIRADLTYAQTKYPNEKPGDVTYEEAFTVQPFNNYMVSMTLTGQNIYDLLTQQVTGANAGIGKSKTLQVSQGFTYEMTPLGPVAGSVKINGVALDKAASYRVTTNNFLSDGGDNFPAFKSGTGKYFGGLDIDAFTPIPADGVAVRPGAADPDHRLRQLAAALTTAGGVGRVLITRLPRLRRVRGAAAQASAASPTSRGRSATNR